MKLNEPIEISLFDFFKYGKFGYIQIGQTKEWILNNFPDPDGFDNSYLAPKITCIWKYGDIEFSFDESNKLTCIRSHIPSDFNGGENLKLNKWILEDYAKLNLAFVLAELNRQEINYLKTTTKGWVHLALDSGVSLNFLDFQGRINIDPNKLMLESFGSCGLRPTLWPNNFDNKMKSKEPVKISLFDFLKFGKFAFIQLGQTKEWILSNFPVPDNYVTGNKFDDVNIWRYAGIEFHFNSNNELCIICSDSLNFDCRKKKITLDKWIFEDLSKLNLLYVLTELNKHDIDYKKRTDKFGVFTRLQSGVELFFENVNDNLSSNELSITSFLFR